MVLSPLANTDLSLAKQQHQSHTSLENTNPVIPIVLTSEKKQPAAASGAPLFSASDARNQKQGSKAQDLHFLNRIFSLIKRVISWFRESS